MMTVDTESNLWATDVALHQVFRISQAEAFGGQCTPDLTLGTAVREQFNVYLRHCVHFKKNLFTVRERQRRRSLLQAHERGRLTGRQHLLRF